jgi:CubicO group peptidase (beta-lactamase class C family)
VVANRYHVRSRFAHDLLTHTSGLPNALSLIPSDPATRYRQAWKPGERFYYSNLGFDILGNLIETIDERTWPMAVKARVLDPLSMGATAPIITNDIRPRTAESWVRCHITKTVLIPDWGVWLRRPICNLTMPPAALPRRPAT